MTAEPRNLLDGWCPEGATLYEAASAIPIAMHQAREAEFGRVDTGEARAATYLHLFTGKLPHLEDANGRQGAVDLSLHEEHQLTAIVEVTSTIDSGFQRDSAQLHRLIEDINRRYDGSGFWALGFEYGWRMPANRELPDLAHQLCSGLLLADATGSEESDGAVKIGEKVLAYRVAGPSLKRVRISSWSANTPNSSEAPYLDRLAAYLKTSDVIAKKILKLTAEQSRFGSDQQHLYLLMASTGRTGGLFPASPSYFTWGDFICPKPITDLWLDGGSGEIYHWSVNEGWVFHRVQDG